MSATISDKTEQRKCSRCAQLKQLAEFCFKGKERTKPLSPGKSRTETAAATRPLGKRARKQLALFGRVPELIRPGRQRVAAGLSLRQAAKLLGLTAPQLADYEHGRAQIPADTAAAMARVYGCGE